MDKIKTGDVVRLWNGDTVLWAEVVHRSGEDRDQIIARLETGLRRVRDERDSSLAKVEACLSIIKGAEKRQGEIESMMDDMSSANRALVEVNQGFESSSRKRKEVIDHLTDKLDHRQDRIDFLANENAELHEELANTRGSISRYVAAHTWIDEMTSERADLERAAAGKDLPPKVW